MPEENKPNELNDEQLKCIVGGKEEILGGDGTTSEPTTITTFIAGFDEIGSQK